MHTGGRGSHSPPVVSDRILPAPCYGCKQTRGRSPANADGARLPAFSCRRCDMEKIPQTDKSGYFLAGCICCLILLSGLICFPCLHLLACVPSDDLPPLSLSASALASCPCWPDCERILSRRIVPLCPAGLPCFACAVPCRIAATAGLIFTGAGLTRYICACSVDNSTIPVDKPVDKLVDNFIIHT